MPTVVLLLRFIQRVLKFFYRNTSVSFNMYQYKRNRIVIFTCLTPIPKEPAEVSPHFPRACDPITKVNNGHIVCMNNFLQITDSHDDH